MTTTLNASTAGAGGFIATSDNSGVLALQTAGTTAVTIDTSQNTTFVGKVTSAGALTLASNGTTTAITIDTSQNVLLGATSQLGNEKLSVQVSAGKPLALKVPSTSTYTQVDFVNPNGTVGNINTSGSNTSYNTSSDYRLKENIAPMTGALAKVTQLKPVTYKWKVDGSDGEGFIAHELAEVCSHAVTGEKDAVDVDGKPIYQGIDVSFLVATLTAAIQEQQATINALTARVVALEAK